jgi:hypothetical protein
VDCSELIAKFRVWIQLSSGSELFKENYTFSTLFLANRTGIVGFEVLTPVTTKITVCWDVTSLVIQLFRDFSEEPVVSSIRVDWSHLNLWLLIETT